MNRWKGKWFCDLGCQYAFSQFNHSGRAEDAVRITHCNCLVDILVANDRKNEYMKFLYNVGGNPLNPRKNALKIEANPSTSAVGQ
jgi:hypothetical protein